MWRYTRWTLGVAVLATVLTALPMAVVFLSPGVKLPRAYTIAEALLPFVPCGLVAIPASPDRALKLRGLATLLLAVAMLGALFEAIVYVPSVLLMALATLHYAWRVEHEHRNHQHASQR